MPPKRKINVSQYAADEQRRMAREVIARRCLTEGMQAMREHGWRGGLEVVRAYAPAYDRLAPIERTEEE